MNWIKIMVMFIAGFIMTGICIGQDHEHHSGSIKKENMKHIKDVHDSTRSLSVQTLFKGLDGTVKALQIKKGGLLESHITKTDALLVCISGEVAFENENGLKQTLQAGEYLAIEPLVKHWVNGIQDSQLLLIK